MILRQEEIVSPKAHSNFRRKESSPLNGDCLQSSVVNGCKKTSNDTPENSPHYIGLRENTFKDGLYKHKNFSNIKLKRAVPNFETTYRTERKINKRYHI